MSRKKVVVLCFCYFAVLMAYVLYSQLRQPLGSASVGNPAVIGGMIGEAVAVYLMSGVIPIIVWAFFRFRAEYFAAPLAIWIILGIGCLTAIGVEEGHERKAELDGLTSTPMLTGADRSDFVRNFTKSCTATQQANESNRAAGLTPQQLNAFCSCYGERMGEVVTTAEFRDFSINGQPSASFKEKVAQLQQPCAQAMLGK
jgi:hypothetical protein